MSRIPVVKFRQLQGDILPLVFPAAGSLPQKRRGGRVIIDDGHLYRAIKVPIGIEVQGEMELETHTMIDCEQKKVLGFKEEICRRASLPLREVDGVSMYLADRHRTGEG